MVSNDLGACEWFVWDLRRSGLIDRGQLDSIVSEFLKRNPRAEAPSLAEFLVSQGTLTQFQAERVLNGKSQGLVLGPYVLLDAIGSGSMGQVYRASSKNDGAEYAVKVLPRRSMWNVRLARRQVRSFGGFSHSAVVPFVDVGTAGGLHYLVWPLVEGTTLETLVQHNGRLESKMAALYAVQVAQGLSVSHENNLFHGLVKPSNIMVGSDNQARILDFGIGSLLVENEGESLVDTMSTANTLTSGLDCASPECIMEPSNRTPAGDQYSVGCVLYYCLTGRVPFPDGSAVEKMMAHQTQQPEPIQKFAPEVPKGLVDVVARLMSKKPEERYGGCDQVAEALEQYVGDARANSTAPAAGSARAAIQSSRQLVVPSSRGGSAGRMPPVAERPPAAKSSNLGVRVPTPPPLPSSIPPGNRTPGPPADRKPAPLPTRAATNRNDDLPPIAEEIDEADNLPVTRPVVSRQSARGMPVQAPARVAPGRTAPPPGRATAPKSVPATKGAPAARASAAKMATSGAGAIPANWVDEDADGKAPRSFGPIGMIAAALLLMVIVYLGATVLMKQQ
jgi:serine/threonine protein kinase